MAFSTKSTEEVLLQKHYADLVHLLSRCIDDLLLRLVSNGVIDIDQKNVIRKYGDTPGDKIQYLLDNHVVRPLGVGINDSFMKLLSVMKEFPSCCQLVAAMEGRVLQKLSGGAESENSSDHEDPNGQGKFCYTDHSDKLVSLTRPFFLRTGFNHPLKKDNIMINWL